MAAFDESKNCDNLYFKKDVHYWTEYMIDGIEASCKYSQPPDTEWTGSQVELQTKFRKVFTITEKAPTRALTWLKPPTSAFTFKTLC